MLSIVASTSIGSATQFTAGVTIGIPDVADVSLSVSGELVRFIFVPMLLLI